jgi:hypothetical protein
MTSFDPHTPPPSIGSFEDARRLAEWDFLRKTPEQRLQWLIEMLDIGYASGAFPRPGQPVPEAPPSPRLPQDR